MRGKIKGVLPMSFALKDRDFLRIIDVMSQQRGKVRKISVDKEKFTQINVMQRSSGEMGKFDNA